MDFYLFDEHFNGSKAAAHSPHIIQSDYTMLHVEQNLGFFTGHPAQQKTVLARLHPPADECRNVTVVNRFSR